MYRQGAKNAKMKVAPGDLIGAAEHQAELASVEGEPGESQPRSILELRGLGKQLWQQIDSTGSAGL